MSDDAASVSCPGCNKKYRLNEKLLGKKIRCKGCETLFRVPLKPESKHVVGLAVVSPQEKKRRPSSGQSRKKMPGPYKQDSRTAPKPAALKIEDDQPLSLEDDAYDAIPKEAMYQDLEGELDSHTDYDIDYVTDETAKRLKQVSEVQVTHAKENSPLQNTGDLKLADDDLNSDGMFDLADDPPKPQGLAMGAGMNLDALASLEDAEDDGMSFTSDEQPPQHHQKCPSCGAKMSPGAVVCVECGYNMNLGKRMGKAKVMSSSTVVKADEGIFKGKMSPDMIREYWAPLALCGLGLILPIILSIIVSVMSIATGDAEGAVFGLADLFLSLGKTLVINVIGMVIIAYVTAAVLGISFGNLYTAMLKFAGISLVMSSSVIIAVIVAFLTGWIGLIGGFIALVALQVTMMVHLFEDVSIQDAVIYCVIQYIIAPIVLTLLFMLLGVGALSLLL